jgi:hypothetical protein
MADWMNYLTPAPRAPNINALSVYYRPPSLRDVVAVAAYGDARQNARIRKKLQEIRIRDEIAKRHPFRAHGQFPIPGNGTGLNPVRQSPVQPAAPGERKVDHLLVRVDPGILDRIERSAGRRKAVESRK